MLFLLNKETKVIELCDKLNTAYQEKNMGNVKLLRLAILVRLRNKDEETRKSGAQEVYNYLLEHRDGLQNIYVKILLFLGEPYAIDWLKELAKNNDPRITEDSMKFLKKNIRFEEPIMDYELMMIEADKNSKQKPIWENIPQNFPFFGSNS